MARYRNHSCLRSRHRAVGAPPARAVARQARDPAGAAQARKALASRHRAPASWRFEHERHLKVVNEAADQPERLAEDSRGGKVSRNAVKVSAAAALKAARRGGRPRLRRGGAPGRRRGPRPPRSVRVPGCPTTGRPPLCALPVPSRAGSRHRQRDLLHRRRRRPAVGAGQLPGRCVRCRRACCSSWTSPSRTWAPSVSSAS